MKKIKFNLQSNLNRLYPKYFYTTPKEPSQTELGHAYTINELFERAKKGMMPEINHHQYIYDDESDADLDNPDPTRDPDFGIADATQLKDEIDERIAYQRSENDPNDSDKEEQSEQDIEDEKQPPEEAEKQPIGDS